jgi:hypothetical protein
MGKISFIMDLWADFDKKHYMAVTAYWLEKTSLLDSESSQQQVNLCTDLIGFMHIPGNHTGEHLAEVFFWILEHLKITKKVRIIFYSNKGITYIIL